MPSMRRMRIYGVILFAVVLYILYVTGNARQAQSNDFYRSTKDALEDLEKSKYHPHQNPLDRQPASSEDELLALAMANRLKDAERVAKDNANEKAPTRESVMGAEEKKSSQKVEDIGTTGEKSVAGRKKYLPDDVVSPKKPAAENEEDKEVEIELNNIFKRSPIIIFSKSYCPHSKRAKGILLEKYSIIPAPFVVELDLHPQGKALQARLAEMTGRSTVPNVMINGKSIGGGDDVAELDSQKTLIDTVKTMGGKQMQEVVERPQHDI